MPRHSVAASDELWTRLELMAKRRNVSVSRVIREALQETYQDELRGLPPEVSLEGMQAVTLSTILGFLCVLVLVAVTLVALMV